MCPFRLQLSRLSRLATPAPLYFAEAVGFEPTNRCRLPVFKTGAIDHSAILPFSMAHPLRLELRFLVLETNVLPIKIYDGCVYLFVKPPGLEPGPFRMGA